jgi:predicted dehydrogenase
MMAEGNTRSVGFIGCGHIAERHARALRRVRGLRLTAVCDRDLARARAWSERHGRPRATASLAELLGPGGIDAVHVLTPPESHHALVTQALAAGCDVLVEKPMAMTVTEARDMANAAARAGKLLAVCHSYLFVPAMVTARRRVAGGELGAITSADVYWRMSTYRPDLRPDAIAWMKALPGGPFLEVLPHLVYLLRSVAGEITLVAALRGKSASAEEPTELRALFTSPIGPVTLAVSLAAQPVEKILTIRGTSRTLHVDLATGTLVDLAGHADTPLDRARAGFGRTLQWASGLTSNGVRAATGTLTRGHDGLIAAFYRAITEGSPSPVGAEEAVATMCTVEALIAALAPHADSAARS